jgi:hypothetical protein
VVLTIVLCTVCSDRNRSIIDFGKLESARVCETDDFEIRRVDKAGDR